MTFLAPWALLAGALAATGLVALHLVARQRPAAYPLPTARFVPDRRTLVSRVSRRPRDLLLLLLRVVLVLSAAAAFARPVLTPRRSALARVLVLDHSAAVADHAETMRQARTIMTDDVPTRIVVFDSMAAVLGEGVSALDSLQAASPVTGRAVGSLSAAFAAARRVAADVGARADSVELVLVSPLTARELDAATDSVRATWPGSVRMVRVAAAVDSATTPALERAIGDADVLGPALGARAVRTSSPGAGRPSAPTVRLVRLLRRPLVAGDSAFARDGGIVVRWDSIGSRTVVPSGVAMGDDVIVAPLGRGVLQEHGIVLARWADGSPAATETVLGDGCVRQVALGVPDAGDLPLSSSFQRVANGLTGACAGSRDAVGVPLDSARVAAIAGPARMATGASLTNGAERPTPIAAWLLGLALACALAELLVRRSGGASDPAEAAAA